jgi:hypothetical protein
MNGIQRNKIKFHLVEKTKSAFALPDHHLVLYTGLIEDCENAEELVSSHKSAWKRPHHAKLTGKLVVRLISMTTKRTA